MQRTKLYATDGDHNNKLYDVERRDARRAETRLKNGLHSLEEARQYHVNTMIREQRRIQRDLTRIRQGYSKTKPTTSFGNWIPGTEKDRSTFVYKKFLLPTIPSGNGMESGGLRTQKYFPTRISRLGTPAGHPHALQMRINNFIEDVSSRNGKPSAQTPDVPERISTPGGMRKVRTESSIADINMSSVKFSIAKRLSISGQLSQEGHVSDNEGQEASTNQDKAYDGIEAGEEVFKQNSAVPTSEKQSLSIFLDNPTFDTEVYAPDGNLRTVHTMPNFLDALAEAKKARYIRYRGVPESEKELSIPEIFGKEKTLVQRCPVGE